jgi:haloalkane dehalogenase
MIIEGNAFIEHVLPNSIVRHLDNDEMAAYRAPFLTKESRRPVLAFPRELPIAGEPADVDCLLRSAYAALAASNYPKLLFVGAPGALVSPDFAQEFAARLRSISVMPLGSGRHNLQEDHPDAIGRSIAGWIAGIEAVTATRIKNAA